MTHVSPSQLDRMERRLVRIERYHVVWFGALVMLSALFMLSMFL